MKHKVTAIICTKNEEMSIGNVIKDVWKYVDEILVVDSKNSYDATKKIAKSLGAKVFMDDGIGKGSAMKLGIKKAGNDILVFIDGDGSHNPHDIPKLILPIIKDEADMVIASRILGGSEDTNTPISDFFRKLFGQLITLIINLSCRSQLTDCQNGFRAIKRNVALQLGLQANYFDIESEMTIKCLKKGFRIIEIPSKEFKRKFGKSRINLFIHGPHYIWTIFSNLLR